MLDCVIASFTNNPLSIKVHQRTFHPSQTNPNSVSLRVRCSGTNMEEEEAESKDYYQLLEVSVDSTAKEIKNSYRRLQKKYHPDIAGDKGHEYTLMLNKAYQALMRDDIRRRYDISLGKKREGFESNFSGRGYSSWNGPIRPQSLFVDESRCIGCRECVHLARKTFVIDDVLGSARVKVQFGDDEKNIEVSIESCPTNCIHWVETDDLPILEYLTRPQPKEEHGIYGGGWERPKNVFSAAKSFNKQLKQREEEHNTQNSNNIWEEEVEEETAAQAQARYEASVKLRWEQVLEPWSYFKKLFGFK